MRDELSYLEPMRRQLAEVLYKQAGSLPSVTLSSNLVAQAENYAQQFKAQKGDLDGLEELKILYSELQTYLWVTQLFIEQDSPNQEVVEALRKLKGQIVNHSEYLAEKTVFFSLPTQAEIEEIEQKIDTLIQEIDVIFPGGEFSIQQTGDPFAHLKTEFASLKNKLTEYKNLKEVPYSTRVQRVLEMSEQVKPLLKKAGEYIRFTLKLGRSIPPIGPVGLAVKTISLLLDIQELLDACQKLDNSEKLSELNQALKNATKETEIALKRATSAECQEVDAPLDKLNTEILKLINDKNLAGSMNSLWAEFNKAQRAAYINEGDFENSHKKTTNALKEYLQKLNEVNAQIDIICQCNNEIKNELEKVFQAYRNQCVNISNPAAKCNVATTDLRVNSPVLFGFWNQYSVNDFRTWLQDPGGTGIFNRIAEIQALMTVYEGTDPTLISRPSSEFGYDFYVGSLRLSLKRTPIDGSFNQDTQGKIATFFRNGQARKDKLLLDQRCSADTTHVKEIIKSIDKFKNLPTDEIYSRFVVEAQHNRIPPLKVRYCSKSYIFQCGVNSQPIITSSF